MNEEKLSKLCQDTIDCISNYNDGDVVEYLNPTQTLSGSAWTKTTLPVWQSGLYYRSVPTPPFVPWEFIDKHWNYFAVDTNGDSYLYEEKPFINDPDEPYFWVASSKECEEVTNLLNIANTGKCDWKDSLVKRPKGE